MKMMISKFVLPQASQNLITDISKVRTADICLTCLVRQKDSYIPLLAQAYSEGTNNIQSDSSPNSLYN